MQLDLDIPHHEQSFEHIDIDFVGETPNSAGFSPFPLNYPLSPFKSALPKGSGANLEKNGKRRHHNLSMADPTSGNGGHMKKRTQTMTFSWKISPPRRHRPLSCIRKLWRPWLKWWMIPCIVFVSDLRLEKWLHVITRRIVPMNGTIMNVWDCWRLQTENGTVQPVEEQLHLCERSDSTSLSTGK
jgi:hypothetical protein